MMQGVEETWAMIDAHRAASAPQNTRQEADTLTGRPRPGHSPGYIIEDQAGHVEEVGNLLHVLLENMDGSGDGAKYSAVLAIAIRELTAVFDALCSAAADMFPAD